MSSSFIRLSISIIFLVLVWSASANFHEDGLEQPISMEEHQQQHDSIDAMELQRASIETVYNLCNMLKGCDSGLLHQALNRPRPYPIPTPPFRI